MPKNKILFTTDSWITDKIVGKFKLKKEKLDSWIQIFSWIFWEDKIILCLSWNTENEILINLTYIYDNYSFVKFIDLWEVITKNNFEYKTGDVLIPNTFINTEWKNPLFIPSLPAGNYEVWNFWVIFNWICLSSFEKKIWDILEKKIWDILEKNYADMVDLESYSILNFFWEEEDFNEKFLILKLCWDSKYYNNLVKILELVL